MAALVEFTCPVCNADIPRSGDERPGEQVYCAYCKSPCVVLGQEAEPESWELEEDF